MHSRCTALVLALSCIVAPAAAGSATWGDDVADLIYLSGTGNVVLWPEDAPGALVSNYLLQRDSGGFVEENALFPDGNTYYSMEVGDEATDTEVSWTDVDYKNLGDPPDLTATFDCGAILPTGLSEAQLGSWFSRSTFVGLEGSGEGTWNLSHGYADVTNDVTMSITGGTKIVGSLTGAGTLSVADGATVRLEQTGSIWPDDNAQANLTMTAGGATGGTLDVTKNKITFSGETETDVLNLVVNAYNSGAWDQPGITSSALAAGEAVGVTDQGVTGVKAAYTLGGDANVDGYVDVSDLSIMGSNYGTSSGATWDMGDLNYDGAVDVSDLSIMGSNYGSDIFPAAGATHAPEPGTLALLALGAVAMLRRRR
jgi:hypothetical protein